MILAEMDLTGFVEGPLWNISQTVGYWGANGIR
jgi:hypothetical protein